MLGPALTWLGFSNVLYIKSNYTHCLQMTLLEKNIAIIISIEPSLAVWHVRHTYDASKKSPPL
jgi:hypothetical protein